MVAWMSGLVIGLQNRAQRFESASDLHHTKVRQEISLGASFFLPPPTFCPPKKRADALGGFYELT